MKGRPPRTPTVPAFVHSLIADLRRGYAPGPKRCAEIEGSSGRVAGHRDLSFRTPWSVTVWMSQHHRMDLGLQGKRALVTGGSRGIGKAIARVLAQEGCDVALLARNREPLDAAARELAAESRRNVIGVVASTTNDEQVKAAVAEAVQRLGGTIDILVNAAAEPAGFAAPPQLADIGATWFHAEMDTKVMGYIRCAREVAPGMQATRWGRIVNISGLAARQTGNAVGSMRNVAVAAFTK